MDHSTPLPSTQPWRAAAVVAAAVATVEFFILLLIGIAFATQLFDGNARRSTGLPQAPAAEQPAAESNAPVTQQKSQSSAPAIEPMLPRGETAVIVLNGNGIAGAAATTADRVRARGYLISGSANAPRSDFSRSVIMFRPGFEREAERLASDMQIKRVGPLDGIGKRDLQGAHLAVIIGG